MSDLIARLRWHQKPGAESDVTTLMAEAAAELERQSNNAAILAQQVADLTAELAALRADGEVLAKANTELDGENEALTAERDALRSVATQVLRDMRAQGLLLEWQSALSDALAARAQEPK